VISVWSRLTNSLPGASVSVIQVLGYLDAVHNVGQQDQQSLTARFPRLPAQVLAIELKHVERIPEGVSRALATDRRAAPIKIGHAVRTAWCPLIRLRSAFERPTRHEDLTENSRGRNSRALAGAQDHAEPDREDVGMTLRLFTKSLLALSFVGAMAASFPNIGRAQQQTDQGAAPAATSGQATPTTQAQKPKSKKSSKKSGNASSGKTGSSAPQ
jgi:hypothetical protein